MPGPPASYSLREVARIFNVRTGTLKTWIARGRLKASTGTADEPLFTIDDLNAVYSRRRIDRGPATSEEN